MGYRKISDIGIAEKIIDGLMEQQFPQTNTAYRLLLQISNEWRDTKVGYRAKSIIEEYYRDFTSFVEM